MRHWYSKLYLEADLSACATLLLDLCFSVLLTVTPRCIVLLYYVRLMYVFCLREKGGGW